MSLPMPKVGGLGEALQFLMLVGAANSDATTEQRAVLREHLPPLLDQFRLDGETWPVVKEIRRVLGSDWQPKGEWMDWLGDE